MDAMNALMMMLMLATDTHIDDKHFSNDNTYTIITTIIKLKLFTAAQLTVALLIVGH